MLKKIVFPFLFFLCLQDIFAQSNIGLQIGIDYTKLSTFEFIEEPFVNILQENFTFPSLLFGIEGKHYLSKRVIGEVSIAYTLKKGIAKNDFMFDPTLYELAIQFGSLISSASFKYEVFKNTIIGAGIQSRYILNAQSKLANGTTDFAKYNKNNMGILLSMGYNFKSFSFEMSYSRGKKIDLDLNSRFFNLVEQIESIDLGIIYNLEL